MKTTCACGGRMTTPDGITGYWPYVPQKCVVCGVVDYIDMPSLAEQDKRNLEALYPPTADVREQVRALTAQVATLTERVRQLEKAQA